MNALTLSDLNAKVNGEPRIADLRLAELLGFLDPHKIRNLIDRHRVALERFGIILSTKRVSATVAETSKGGRPGKCYWLNKKQALYICTKSETENATDVTIQMVDVFDAWQSGAAPRLAAPVDRPMAFDPGSNIAMDLLQAVRSANNRMINNSSLSFGVALAETLQDTMARKDDPAAITRGALFDHDYARAQEALYRKMKAAGRDVQPPKRPRRVDPQEYASLAY